MDEYIAPILFSYRASVNDTTGFSPFKMETGRRPLPTHALFPDLRSQKLTEKEYVKQITNSLDEMFSVARTRQFEASEKNRLRKPHVEYDPDLKPGDQLLIWENSASETRLEGGKSGVIPKKITAPYQGPYEMVRWSGKRKVEVLRGDKVEEYNVNRVTKQIPWDEDHLDTSGILEQRKKNLPEEKDWLQGEPAVGQIVIFGYTEDHKHQSPFGVGRITEVRSSEDLKFQWLGNVPYNRNGKFKNGWYDTKGVSYYNNTKLYHKDTAMDSDSTGTKVGDHMLYARGDDLLDAEGHLTKRAKKLTAKYGGIQW